MVNVRIKALLGVPLYIFYFWIMRFTGFMHIIFYTYRFIIKILPLNLKIKYSYVLLILMSVAITILFVLGIYFVFITYL